MCLRATSSPPAPPRRIGWELAQSVPLPSAPPPRGIVRRGSGASRRARPMARPSSDCRAGAQGKAHSKRADEHASLSCRHVHRSIHGNSQAPCLRSDPPLIYEGHIQSHVGVLTGESGAASVPPSVSTRGPASGRLGLAWPSPSTSSGPGPWSGPG